MFLTYFAIFFNFTIFVILINKIFIFFADHFYKISTQDKTFLDTNIITLPNVRIKRLAESLVTNTSTTTQQKHISIQAIIDKNNGTKQTKQGKYLQIYTLRIRNVSN